MIVKIVSKFKSPTQLQRGLTYVQDEKKCITATSIDKLNIDDELEFIKDEIQKINNKYDELDLSDNKKVAVSNGFNRVLNYMVNEKKVEKQFVTGYLCDVSSAQDDFILAAEEDLERQNKTFDDATGNLAYHIVQSFPEGLDISDEEVHQCGLELVKKLEKYQAVVTSHIHPVMDDDSGELKGKCKHNHILLNAYIHPDFIDPDHPEIIKYHDCKETYNQLQIWNDEIALEHGLPIIIEPDMDKTYSWFTSAKENEGKSWIQRVKIDIDNTMRVTTNWNEFKKKMTSMGYKIKEGKYVSYSTPDNSPDHKQVVRDAKLGSDYTKQAIEDYFELRRSLLNDIKFESDRNNSGKDVFDLEEFLSKQNTECFVYIKQNKSGKHASKNKTTGQSYISKLPLKKDLKKESYSSYFKSEDTYDILNDKDEFLVRVSGDDMIKYFKTKEKEMEDENLKRIENELNEYNKDNIKVDKSTKVLFHVRCIHYRTKKPYSIGIYDQFGRRRSSLELLFMLALIILNNEAINWFAPASSVDDLNNPIFAKRDWKVQNMIDSVAMVREYNFNSSDDINKKLKTIGNRMSQLKRENNVNNGILNKMEYLNMVIQKYNSVKDVCEQMYDLPPGFEKKELIAKNIDKLDVYKETKAILYKNKLLDKEAMEDFLKRFDAANNKKKDLEEQLAATNEEYRKFKKLQYNIQLAQNEQYLCGPGYSYEFAHDLDPDDIINNRISEEDVEKMDEEIKSKDKTK